MAEPKITSREYKIMLRAGLFRASEKEIELPAAAFWHNFENAIQHVALTTDGRFDVNRRRLIRFHDTPNRSLRANGYVFRERTDELSDEREVTLKFRHPDRYLSMSRRPKAASRRKAKTKLEEDIKTPFRSLYSHSTTQSIGRNKNLNNLNDPFKLFPCLPNELRNVDDRSTAIGVVGGLTARELVLTGTSFRIRHKPKVEAECALIVWYDLHGDRHCPEVVEFSFRYGDHDEDYGPKASQRAYEIFNKLQSSALADWTDPAGVTKTAYAYGRS